MNSWLCCLPPSHPPTLSSTSRPVFHQWKAVIQRWLHNENILNGYCWKTMDAMNGIQTMEFSTMTPWINTSSRVYLLQDRRGVNKLKRKENVLTASVAPTQFPHWNKWGSCFYWHIDIIGFFFLPTKDILTCHSRKSTIKMNDDWVSFSSFFMVLGWVLFTLRMQLPSHTDARSMHKTGTFSRHNIVP